MTPLFGFLDDAKEALTELLTGLLMVAGGFLVGYLLGGVLAWGVGKYVFKQKDNEILKRLGRPIGGVLVAIIVAVIVFTGRGKPHGAGGDGKGIPDDTAGKNPPKVNDPKPPDLPPIKPVDPKTADAPILVTVYGGARVGGTEKFYRFEAENDLRTLAGLQEAVKARKAVAKGKLTLQIRMPEERNDRPADPRIITQVTEWAYAEGIDVTFPASK